MGIKARQVKQKHRGRAQEQGQGQEQGQEWEISTHIPDPRNSHESEIGGGV